MRGAVTPNSCTRLATVSPSTEVSRSAVRAAGKLYGLITSQTSTLTEESAAKLMASMAAMEPETMPETGGQALPLSGALLALGGMAFLGGLSLLRPSLSGRGR